MQPMMEAVKSWSLPVMSGPCAYCTAECCRYIALPMDRPTRARDFDDIRWYLMHEGIQVFVDEGDWYIQFRTQCRNLADDNRCKVYETRPKICREYKAGDCDYAPGEYNYEHHFTKPEQIEAFGKEFLAKERAKKRALSKRKSAKRVAAPKRKPAAARTNGRNSRTLSLGLNGRARKTG